MDRAMYAAHAALQQEHWWYRGRRAVLRQVLADMKLPPDARILEAGCGPGGNLAMLAAFGRVSAFEIDPECVALAQDVGRADVRHGAFPDRIPFDGDFDAAVALDVIEHLDSDDAAMAALVARVKPGGAVLVTVPAYQWLWSAHDERNHHKRRYRRGAVTALFRRHGIDIAAATYFNSLLFPLAAGVRLMGMSGREEEMPEPFVNRLFHRIFAFERHLLRLGSLPAGMSILVWGRR